VHNPEASSSTAFGGCQICKGGDHLATTCPRLNEARPKCAKCGMPHRTENCGIKCTYAQGWGILRTDVRRSPKMGNHNLEQQTSWRCCWMMKQRPCNNLISYVGMGIFSLTPECLGGRCLLKWHQLVLYHHLKLKEKAQE
jgi:hypothetical protein